MDENTIEEFVFDLNAIEEPENLNEVIDNLMVNPNLSPLNYFNEFGDLVPDITTVGKNEIEDYRVIRLDDGKTVLAMTTHAMHHHIEYDPKTAVEILISRAVRRMVCLGAAPKAVTAMLYHINYADPAGFFIASEARKGIESAAEAYNLQISDAKIRFDYFGEHGTQAHTVIVSLLGTVATNDAGEMTRVTPAFKRKGNNIFMLGRPSDDLASSEYLEFHHGITQSPLPEFDLDFEVALQNVVRQLIDKDLVESASPVGRGGLFFTLLRAGWKNELGFDITTDAETRIDSFLFGEAMGRIIVGVDSDKEEEFVDFMYDSKIPFFTVGHVTKGEIRIDDESYGYVDKMSETL